MTRLEFYRELYQKYLTTPTKQWNDVIALPTKTKTSEAIFQWGDLCNHDIGALVTDFLARGKNVWLWSDIHFNHKNICSHANRPFLSLTEMHDSLIKGYFSVVKEDDLVIWGGDISFGNFQYVNQIINEMPGTKALIIGNHDFNFKNMKPVNYNCFQYINSVATFMLDNQEIVMTHYPLDLKHLPEGVINIHGHTHQHLMGPRRINMSVEHTDYKPKNLTTFIS